MGDQNLSLKKAFTYALTPLSQGINPMKNKVLVTDHDEVEGDHVRVHVLQSTEKLAGMVAYYRKDKCTKAVVIVNIADSLILEPAHLEGLESSNFPLLVVSQSDGEELISMFNQPDEILCDINVESAVDHPQAMTEQSNAGGAVAPRDRSSSMSSVYGNVIVNHFRNHSICYKQGGA